MPSPAAHGQHYVGLGAYSGLSTQGLEKEMPAITRQVANVAAIVFGVTAAIAAALLLASAW